MSKPRWHNSVSSATNITNSLTVELGRRRIDFLDNYIRFVVHRLHKCTWLDFPPKWSRSSFPLACIRNLHGFEHKIAASTQQPDDGPPFKSHRASSSNILEMKLLQSYDKNQIKKMIL